MKLLIRTFLLVVTFSATVCLADVPSLILDDFQAPQQVRCADQDRSELDINVYSGPIGRIYGGERSVQCKLLSSALPLGEVTSSVGLLRAELNSSPGAAGVASIVLDGPGVGSVLPESSVPELSKGFAKPINLNLYSGLIFQLYFDYPQGDPSDLTFFFHSAVDRWTKYTVVLSRALNYENIFVPLKFSGLGETISLRGTTIPSPLKVIRSDSTAGAADLSKIIGIRIVFNGDPDYGRKASADIQLSGSLGGLCLTARCLSEECLTRSSIGLQHGCMDPIVSSGS